MRYLFTILVLTGMAAAQAPHADNDSYCPATSVPTWGVSDGPATLPQVCYRTNVANTPATGAVVNVLANNATDLQTKLTAATCGQKITLPSGSSYSGHFTLPAISCPDTNYLWITTSDVASLPAEGARFSTAYNGQTLYLPTFGPCYSGVASLPGRPAFSCPVIPGTYTAQIVTPNTAPDLTFNAGTRGVRITGIEFTRAPATGYVTDLISLGDNGDVSHIILDRVWCHGNELGDETNRCARDSGASYFAVVDSFLNDFYCVSVAGACTDSKTIGGGSNVASTTQETALKYVNNYLEAAGENMIHGGAGGNTVPADFEIRLNLFFKPLTWLPIDPSYDGGQKGGHPLIVKNILEWKNGQRILVEGNQLVNTWGGFTQHGPALVITPANQNTNQCPVCKVENITFRNNLVTTANSFGVWSIAPNLAESIPAGGNHWSIHDNVADNLGYCGANSAYCPTSQAQIQLVTNPDNITTSALTEHDITINHNTLVYNSAIANTRNTFGVSGPTIASGANMWNITFTNNVMGAGAGLTNSSGGANNCATGSAGAALVTSCWSPYVFGNNCFVNNGSEAWPGVNVTSVASYTALFVNYNSGNGGNYVVASGACKAAATDTLDIGANVPQVGLTTAGLLVLPKVSGMLFGSSWNHLSATPPPPTWPPTDSNGTIAAVSSFRMWDDGIKWSHINTAAGVYDFSKMDAVVNTLITSPVMKGLYTFGGMPKFASACSASADPSTCLPGPAGSGYGGGTKCSGPTSYGCLPPGDVATDGTGTDSFFQTFVSTLVARYPNKIAYYGMWNEADATNFWCQTGGTVPCGGGNANTTPNTASLKRQVRMSWDAYNIIHCLSPASQVVSPGVHVATALTWMHNFAITSISAPAGNIAGCTWPAATVTGKMTFDITNAHMRGTTNSDPTQVITAYNNIVTEITNDGLPTALFDDEFGPLTGDANNVDILAAYVGIEYALQGSFQNPQILMANYYQFDSNGGFALQGTIGGLAFNTLASWLTNATMTPCTVVGTIYTCNGTTGGGTTFVIAWDMSKNCTAGCTTANHVFGGTFPTWADLAGVTHVTTGGNGTAPLGLKPIMLLQSTTPVLALAVNGGNNQSGLQNTTLPTALTVLATSDGTPQAGVSVTFSDGGAGGSFGTSPATTNGSGIASTTYTLPNTATVVTITATATSYSPTTFTETSTANVNVISITAGDGQTGNLSTLLPTSLSVLATVNGTPTNGVSVAFSDAGAGGSFGATPVVTSGGGHATTTYTLPNSARVVSIGATASTYAGATFTETAAALVVSPTAGNNQSGTVSTILPLALQARATNNGAGVAGLTVAFSDAGAGGVFGSPTAVTNGSGFVTTTYTLPATPQNITITAATSGYTSGTFSAHAVTQIIINVSGNNQVGLVNTLLSQPLVVRSDVNGVATAGIPVAFSDAGAGGTFTTPSGSTGVDGTFSTTYTLPVTAQSVTITVTSAGFTPVPFTATSFVPSAPTDVRVTPGTRANNAIIH